jgi:hypothetical protein
MILEQEYYLEFHVIIKLILETRHILLKAAD